MNLHFVHECFLTRTIFFNDGYLDKGRVGMVKYIPYICGNERKEYHFITIRESGPPAESPDRGEMGRCVRELQNEYQAINESGTAAFTASYAFRV